MKIIDVPKQRLRVVSLAILTLVTGSVQGQLNASPGRVTLRVLVLDGHDGKPVRGHVVLITSSTTDSLAKGRTDHDGVFSVTREFPERIAAFVPNRPGCFEKKTVPPRVSVEDIVIHGVVEPNSCNPKVQHSALPGTLILFVRRETVAEVLDLR